MVFEIKSGNVTAKVTSTGAQLCSLKVGDSNELMWQADATYWTSHAPILFPIVGALKEDKALIGGEYYTIPKHGLVRKSEWDLVAQTENSVELKSCANEDTLKAYPFSYTIKAKYEIVEKGVKTTFTIINGDDKKMPYFIGGHPGFNVPFEGGNFSDYELEFAEIENLKSPQIITETSIYDFTKSKLEIENKKSVVLDNEMFSNDVIVYDNFKKNEISIKSTKSGKKLTMNFEELKMLGIWKPYNEASFLCLEPWLGCSTTTTEGDEFTEKTDCQMLEKGEEKSHSFTVIFE